jgi:hypothetical protein
MQRDIGNREFSWIYDHTCNFRIPADGLDPEELELELIDFGAEEVLKMEYWFMVLLPVLEPSKRTWKPQSWNPFVRFWKNSSNH